MIKRPALQCCFFMTDLNYFCMFRCLDNIFFYMATIIPKSCFFSFNILLFFMLFYSLDG